MPEKEVYMKKALSLILIATILTTGLCGCKKQQKKEETIEETKKTTIAKTNTPIYTDVEENNRTILGEAMDIDQTSHDLDDIITTLKKYKAGKIQSVKYTTDGDRILNIIAEDGTEYLFYLNGSCYPESIKNVTTGEWLRMSIQ